MSTLRDRLTPEEWKAYRSAVNRKYAQSEKGKATTRRANASPLAKERYARYRQTEGYKAAQERFKAKGGRNALAKKHRAIVKTDHPEKITAWTAVQLALAAGTIQRADRCQECGRTLHLVAHHHLGYDPSHVLDVRWLCRPCHKAAHA